MTSPRKAALVTIVIATLAVLFLGISGSSAQNAELAEPDVAASDPVLLLNRLIAEKNDQIVSLERRLSLMEQAAQRSQTRVETQRDTILAFQESGRLSPAFQSTAIDEWRVGYRIGGGRNLAAFEDVILPCESGGEPDPDAAIGPTDDWGRAQINRPTWSARFEELTDMPFEDWIRDPVLNGYMAARVEIEHASGLNAWTCWRKRR